METSGYSPFVKELLAEEYLLLKLRPTEAGHPETVRSIREATEETLTGGAVMADASYPRLIRAGLLYAYDALDESHRIVQEIVSDEGLTGMVCCIGGRGILRMRGIGSGGRGGCVFFPRCMGGRRGYQRLWRGRRTGIRMCWWGNASRRDSAGMWIRRNWWGFRGLSLR